MDSKKSNDQSCQKACKLAFIDGKWAPAFKIWKALADEGCMDSSYYTGLCYDFGCGTKANRKKALEYYLHAAEAGEAVAQYNVYMMCRDGQGTAKNLKKAIFWLKKAACQGDSQALRDLGYAYHEGQGLKKNYKLAVKYYKMAAIKGDPKSQWNLSLCYQDGDGVSKSDRWSQHWLIKAAQGGHKDAKEKVKRLKLKSKSTS
jgi:TPR repeat protein